MLEPSTLELTIQGEEICRLDSRLSVERRTDLVQVCRVAELDVAEAQVGTFHARHPKFHEENVVVRSVI